jgi:hypothetical protein
MKTPSNISNEGIRPSMEELLASARNEARELESVSIRNRVIAEAKATTTSGGPQSNTFASTRSIFKPRIQPTWIIMIITGLAAIAVLSYNVFVTPHSSSHEKLVGRPAKQTAVSTSLETDSTHLSKPHDQQVNIVRRSQPADSTRFVGISPLLSSTTHDHSINPPIANLDAALTKPIELSEVQSKNLGIILLDTGDITYYFYQNPKKEIAKHTFYVWGGMGVGLSMSEVPSNDADGLTLSDLYPRLVTDMAGKRRFFRFDHSGDYRRPMSNGMTVAKDSDGDWVVPSPAVFFDIPSNDPKPAKHQGEFKQNTLPDSNGISRGTIYQTPSPRTNVVQSTTQNNLSVQDSIAQIRHIGPAINGLIPVHIRNAKGKQVQDLILWYDRTPEILHALPLESTKELAVQSGSAMGATIQLFVYPNPASAKATLQLKFAEARHMQVAIFGLLGQKLIDVGPMNTKAGETQSISYDVSSLSPGVYLLVATSDNGEQITQRILVER